MNRFKYFVDMFRYEDELDYLDRSLDDMHDRFTVSTAIFINTYELTCSHPDFCNLAIL